MMLRLRNNLALWLSPVESVESEGPPREAFSERSESDRLVAALAGVWSWFCEKCREERDEGASVMMMGWVDDVEV